MKPALAEGQVWTFADAPEETARVVIRGIAPWREGGEIVHVGFHGLPSKGRFTGSVTHMPFDRVSVEASVDRVKDEAAPVDAGFAAALAGWEQVHNDMFRVPLAYALRMMFATMRREDRPL
jgi:hypothetical protein